MIGAILGGFIILGVLLTLAAWLNGKSTKKLIREENERTREVIRETKESTEKILLKISEQIEKIPEKTAYLIK